MEIYLLIILIVVPLVFLIIFARELFPKNIYAITLMPSAFLICTLIYLFSPAMESKQKLVELISQKYPEINEIIHGSLEDGLSNFEYYLNKDLFNSFTDLYIENLEKSG